MRTTAAGRTIEPVLRFRPASVGPVPMEERVRPDERRRYVFLLWFNVTLGVLWAVVLVLTGVWWFAALLAVSVVLGSLSAWALNVLNREGLR